ncbi:type II 3-dehydroquinate dehydratase [bacterium]|nr:type II 3-dehydroquinate dehydratase [bacterium]
MRVFLLHGPNLNMLGTREPGIYGNVTYEQLMEKALDWAEHLDIGLGYAQSNSEGGLIDYIQAALGQFDVIIFNPGAFTHTSYALKEALTAVGLPFIEVHISNIYAREEWRAKSLLAPIAAGSICGFGILGYRLALEAARELAAYGGDMGGNHPAEMNAGFSPASFGREAAFSASAEPGGVRSLSLDLGQPAAGEEHGSVSAKQPPANVDVNKGPMLNVVDSGFDQDDLSNLFMPTQHYEVNVQHGAIDLGNNCGINEINGFSEDGAESLFAGNPEEELSDQEREALRAWMGDDYGGNSANYSQASSPFQPGEDGYMGQSGGTSSSEAYKAIASSDFFSEVNTAKTVDSSSAPKRLSIPIKPKKKKDG